MDHLHQRSLDELMDRVVRERLVDRCEYEGAYVVITQGAARFILSPTRAHAFLRGVIKGMSSRHRGGRPSGLITPGDESAVPRGRGKVSSGLVESFRRHLVNKWWTRYEHAGCPFGSTRSGLQIWMSYGTYTTVS